MKESGTVGERVGMLAVLAVVAGLLVAGLALPFVGGIGLIAKAQDNALAKLPSFLATPPLAQHSLLLAADGSVMATLAGAEDRVIVPADQIPAVVKYSIVAIEDNRFYEHNGVDLRGVLRAAQADTTSGSYDQGASTITEQYVKLVELEAAGNDKAAQKAATEKSLNRKLDDARLAIALEKRETKDQILTNYLNIAFFGEGTYGIGTAAQHYFGIPVNKLSLAQAAVLAGLVNNPTAFDPVKNPRDSLARRNQVLDAVAKYHLLPAATIAHARATKLVVHPVQRTSDSCDTSRDPLFCSYVRQELLADPKLGATAAQRADEVFEGGLKISTSWTPTVQAAVDAGTATHLPDDVRQAASSVVVQPGTGHILAIGQNRQWGRTTGKTTNIYAAQPVYDVGSTFKLMTLTAAIEQGIPLTTSIYSPSCLNEPGYTDGPSFCPHGLTNAGDTGESGTYNLYTGTWDSVNTFFLQLEDKVGGPGAVADMAKRLGIVGGGQAQVPKYGLGDTGELHVLTPTERTEYFERYTFQGGSYGPSLTLGAGGGFSPIDMATAYATIAAHGMTCTPTAVTKITTLAGKPVAFTGSSCHQAVSPTVADIVTSVLQGVLNKPGATGAQLRYIGRPAAGKTGTLDDGQGGWFVGYTPQLAMAVGVFDPKAPGSQATPITDISTGRTFSSSNFYGASIAGPIWSSAMTQAVQGMPVQSFTLREANNTGPAVTHRFGQTSRNPTPPSSGPTTGATTPVTPATSAPPRKKKK